MAGKSPLMSDQTRAKLKAARVARLATIDANRTPHMVPICFSYDGSLFYTAIDRKPKNVPPGRLARLKNIQMNRQVALLIDEYDEDWTRLWYVLVRGEAELVSSLAERAHALAQLQAKYPQYRSGMLADDGPILRITPLRISTWGKLTNTAAEPER
jgi:PPOX class probable F420-dependent enzyme